MSKNYQKSALTFSSEDILISSISSSMISGSSSKLCFAASSDAEDSRVSLTSMSEEIGDPSDDFLEEDDSLFDFESSLAMKSSN